MTYKYPGLLFNFYSGPSRVFDIYIRGITKKREAFILITVL